ncbi:MAG: hypothetical protein V4640_12295 [Verrucomicrobiota bacterium]
MKKLLLATLLVLPPLYAQDTSPTDMAARRQSVVDIKAHLAARETRLAEIASDIRALDDRNEKRIDSIVNTLKGMKDSEDSKTRINALKADVIAGLRRSITIYQQKRRDVFERLRTDKTVSMEALTKDMDRFDIRTQKRVDQIMELAKSMPERKDVEKYESDGGEWWNGYYHETSRISDEWRQNRRQGVATEVALRELRDALDKTIADQEGRRNSIAAQLKGNSLSAASRALQEHELGRTDAMLENLRYQRVELSLPNTNSGTSVDNSASTTTSDGEVAVAADNATEMKDLLEDSRKDITRDFWDILNKYGQATRERDKIIALKQNLAAREKWLLEHDTKPE